MGMRYGIETTSSRSMTPRHTVLFLASLAAANMLAVTVFELTAIWRGDWDAMISPVVLGWFRDHPVATLVFAVSVAFAFGVVVGHCIWPQCEIVVNEKVIDA